jgi:hypothetical protein
MLYADRMKRIFHRKRRDISYGLMCTETEYEELHCKVLSQVLPAGCVV